jgi:hypothetical protein
VVEHLPSSEFKLQYCKKKKKIVKKTWAHRCVIRKESSVLVLFDTVSLIHQKSSGSFLRLVAMCDLKPHLNFFVLFYLKIHQPV